MLANNITQIDQSEISVSKSIPVRIVHIRAQLCRFVDVLAEKDVRGNISIDIRFRILVPVPFSRAAHKHYGLSQREAVGLSKFFRDYCDAYILARRHGKSEGIVPPLFEYDIAPKNQIPSFKPYRDNGVWVFDESLYSERMAAGYVAHYGGPGDRYQMREFEPEPPLPTDGKVWMLNVSDYTHQSAKVYINHHTVLNDGVYAKYML